MSTFFVTGAAGSQGGAVARKLISAGHKVRALVRDPLKPSSIAIQKLGATLVKGDYDNVPALEEVAKGCTGVFILTSLNPPNWGLELEQAKNIIAASKSAGVKNAVLTTATRAEESENFAFMVKTNVFTVNMWKSKKSIQEAVQNAGFESWTILQPAWIMTNWVAPVSAFFWPALKSDKILTTCFAPDTKIDLTAPEDVGGFALKAFEGGLNGEIVKIASEAPTIGECAEIMSQVLGVKISTQFTSEEDIEAQKNANPLVSAQLWGKYDGCRMDYDKMKAYGVPLTSFKEFLEIHKEQLVAALTPKAE